MSLRSFRTRKNLKTAFFAFLNSETWAEGLRVSPAAEKNWGRLFEGARKAVRAGVLFGGETDWMKDANAPVQWTAGVLPAWLSLASPGPAVRSSRLPRRVLSMGEFLLVVDCGRTLGRNEENGENGPGENPAPPFPFLRFLLDEAPPASLPAMVEDILPCLQDVTQLNLLLAHPVALEVVKNTLVKNPAHYFPHPLYARTLDLLAREGEVNLVGALVQARPFLASAKGQVFADRIVDVGQDRHQALGLLMEDFRSLMRKDAVCERGKMTPLMGEAKVLLETINALFEKGAVVEDRDLVRDFLEIEEQDRLKDWLKEDMRSFADPKELERVWEKTLVFVFCQHMEVLTAPVDAARSSPRTARL
jgi:hypothetical protein